MERWRHLTRDTYLSVIGNRQNYILNSPAGGLRKIVIKIMRWFKHNIEKFSAHYTKKQFDDEIAQETKRPYSNNEKSYFICLTLNKF